MATSHSHLSALIRQSKRGGAPTLGAPSAFSVAPEGLGQVPSLDPMPSAVAANQAESPFARLARQRAQERSAAPGGDEDEEPPEPRPVIQDERDSQAQRKDAAPTSLGVPDAGRPAESPFARHSQTARRGEIHAIKSLTRLVEALANSGAAGESSGDKEQAMTALLRKMHQVSSMLALHIAPTDAHRGWVKAAAQSAAAEMVARQFELAASRGASPASVYGAIDAQAQLVLAAFDAANADLDVQAAVASFSEAARYQEANSEEAANDRVALSLRLAAWDLHQAVLNPEIGQYAGAVFAWGRSAQDLVSELLPHCWRVARSSSLDIASLDLRTAHLQGSIRRVASLLGAEYVARTRAFVSTMTRELDRAGPVTDLRPAFAVVLQQAVAAAHSHFEAIEKLAPALMAEAEAALPAHAPRVRENDQPQTS